MFKDKELEDKMNKLGLTNWQKELVRKGKYNPEDFEEDEIDDDSYYSEDDD